MKIRTHVLGIAVAAVAGFILVGGSARAEPVHANTDTQSAPMNYWYVYGHYETESKCKEEGESLLWPANPGGADAYECRAKGDGWDLWLMFLT